METKIIEEWEREKGMFIIDPEIDLNQHLTEQEFTDIPMNRKMGVDFKRRSEWLTNNGYDVTRGNLMDRNLVTKGTE